MTTSVVEQEHIKDEYDIISTTPPYYDFKNSLGYYIYSLSSILKTISDNLSTNTSCLIKKIVSRFF